MPRTLWSLNVGESAYIENLACRKDLRRLLLTLGFCPGASVLCTGQSPQGDPKAYLVRGAVIALRREDCEQVFLKGHEPDAPGTGLLHRIR